MTRNPFFVIVSMAVLSSRPIVWADALVAAAGSTVVHEYAPEYPPQASDISYGLGVTNALPTSSACFRARTWLE